MDSFSFHLQYSTIIWQCVIREKWAYRLLREKLYRNLDQAYRINLQVDTT